MPVGSHITVTGWVTVVDEFLGPVYFQDETGGLAWFDGPLMRDTGEFLIDIAHGDSLVISGPLTEIQTIPGVAGTGFLQIEGDDVEFEVFPEANRNIQPLVITTTQLLTGNFESRFVRINNFSFNHSGTFSNGNYTITDITGSSTMRVLANSNIAGNPVPSLPLDAIGVVETFRNNARFLPRSIDDLNIEPYTFPGDNIPKSETFDVVTWNIEWFGHPTNGPSNIELQYQNVKTIIETIDADLYAFQEIANNALFVELINDLEGYSGIIAPYTQTQKTAYLYRNSTIERINSGLLSTGQNQNDWAGRLPFWMYFNVIIGDQFIQVHSYNVHAKAFADPESYQQRVNSSNQLKAYLDGFRKNDNVLFLGDYNDMLRVSTYNNQTSPYENFVQDPHYFPVSLSLEEAGYTSFRSVSMIDHIIVTNELAQFHIHGAQRVEMPDYINNYLNTTSDHYPVWTRFDIQGLVSIDEGREEDIPHEITLHQNYPNPFNPSTNISFSLNGHHQVTLTVYDITGRRVATLLQNEQRTPGTHQVVFDASRLSSGMYIYRLATQSGAMETGKMLLVK